MTIQRAFHAAVTLCPLLVFVLGTVTCVATVVFFYLAEPDYVATRLPTISYAARAGANLLFTTGIVLTAVCIARSLLLCFTIHAGAISRFAQGFPQHRRKMRRQNQLFLVFGMSAALSLAGATLTLNSGPIHTHLSLAFFATWTLFFLVDTLLVREIGKAAAGEYPPSAGPWMWIRRVIAGALFVCGIAMVIFFYGKEFLPGWLVPRADNVYAILEYLFALLAFGYPGAYFHDLLRVRRGY